MIGKRLQQARKARGLSLRKLSDKVQLSHAAIKKYEDDIVTPSSDVLLKLAGALEVRIEFFFRPENLSLENIQYHKHTNMPKKQLNQISAQILDQIERYVELENLLPHTPIKTFSCSDGVKKIPKNQNDIETLAVKVRNQWQVGLNPITNLIDIFEKNGIYVFEIDNTQYPKFDGLYAQVDHRRVIVIGSQWPGDRQRFTLTHELGHILFDDLQLQDQNLEKCCNLFAGAFLLPEQSLLQFIGKKRHFIDVLELHLIKQEYGISMNCIMHRLEETKVIDNKLYSAMRALFKEKGWDKKEPGTPYPQQKTSLFEQMIFHALAENYLGESKAAELMNTTVEKLRSARVLESNHAAPSQ